jgi:hypothetical protein
MRSFDDTGTVARLMNNLKCDVKDRAAEAYLFTYLYVIPSLIEAVRHPVAARSDEID